MKPCVICPLAQLDNDNAAREYAGIHFELGDDLYARVDRAITLISENPQVSAPRFARLEPGLRVWPIGRFPYLLFYLDGPDATDIIRFLHAHRDLPRELRGR